MNEYVWDQDARVILGHILRANPDNVKDVRGNIALTIDYVQALARERDKARAVSQPSQPPRRW